MLIVCFCNLWLKTPQLKIMLVIAQPVFCECNIVDVLASAENKKNVLSANC
jgi:hypothetical protein